MRKRVVVELFAKDPMGTWGIRHKLHAGAKATPFAKKASISLFTIAPGEKHIRLAFPNWWQPIKIPFLNTGTSAKETARLFGERVHWRKDEKNKCS